MHTDVMRQGAFLTVAIACTAIAGGAACSRLPATGSPEISVSPGTVAFAMPFVGDEYQNALTVTNTGNVALTVTSIALRDDTLGGGSFNLDAPATPFTIAPGRSVSLTVNLHPSSDAPARGAVTIRSNAKANPTIVVPLTTTSVDDVKLEACVLRGSSVAQGCDEDANGAPLIDWGPISKGVPVQKTIALWNSGAGNVAAIVSSLVATTAPETFSFTFFTLDADGREIALEPPLYLRPYDPARRSVANEIRVRATFSGRMPTGPLTDVALEIDTSHPQGKLTIPVAATIGDCPGTLADCDGVAANGCEADLASSLDHCGTCAESCGAANAAPQCVAGGCILNCQPLWGNCDGLDPTGCEHDLSADVGNCGACGHLCGADHASPQCTSGVCALNCAPGFADCDHVDGTGCETDIQTIDNCGACGNVCGTANASPQCVGGGCVLNCQPGFADCDGIASNGCEANLTADPAHCGSCTNDCTALPHPNASTVACADAGAGPACSVATCDASFFDVNGTFADGCECQDDAVSAVCTSPAPGPVVALNTQASLTGRIVPSSKVEYVLVGFTGADSCADFTPTITLDDPSGVLVMDVLPAGGCDATPIGCAEGQALGITQWSTRYTNWCVLPQNLSYPLGTSFLVRVYANGTSATCLPYTLLLSN